MFRKNNFGFLVCFCIANITLFSLKPDILPQSKDKTTKWPEPKFEHITAKDGLPSNSVHYILQDHLGFLWFGTQNGLVKYDGYNMVVYLPEPGNPKSISNGNVGPIYEDNDGTVWAGAGTFEKNLLNRFDRVTETFTQYSYIPEDSTSINSNVVLRIYQDSQSRLWFGTTRGLNLFDKETNHFQRFDVKDTAYSSEVYEDLIKMKNEDKVLSSILEVGNNANITKSFNVDKIIHAIFIVMGENIEDYGWLENEKGETLVKYSEAKSYYAGGEDVNRIQIIPITLSPGIYKLRYISDLNHSYNNWLNQSPTHPDFWGVQIINVDDETEKIKGMLANVNIVIPTLRDIAMFEDTVTGNFLVGFRNGLWKLDTNIGVYSKINLSKEENISSVRAFYQTEDGNIWLSSARGLTKVDPKNFSSVLYQPIPSSKYIRENDFMYGIEFMDSLIWLGSANGSLVCFDPLTEHFNSYRYDQNDPHSLNQTSPEGVYTILKDHSGVLWVCTSEFGLSKWDRFNNKFNSFRFDTDSKDKLDNTPVMSLIEDKNNNIWLGTYGEGLIKLDKNMNIISRYLNDSHKDGSLSNNKVMSIYEDPYENSVLWIGTDGGGLNKFDTKNKIFLRYQHNPDDQNSLSNNFVYYTLADGKDVLWVCNLHGGVNEFDKNSSKFTRYSHDTTDSTSLSSNDVFYSYKDKLGKLWFGTMGSNRGLNQFDYNTNKFLTYGSAYDEDSFSSLVYIYEDRTGNFWLGDYAQGLFLFDRDKERAVMHFSQKDGLVHDQVMSILEDDSGNIWISTYNGLSKFDPVSKTFRNFYEEDGLSSNKFFFSSAFKSKTGEMFFGGENGFTYFYPDSIKDDPVPPLVAITKLSLFNRPKEKLDINGFISVMNQVELSYNQNDLHFEYVGLQFSKPSRNKYRYILENFDEDWVDAGTQRNATYTNLDPGEYIFRVKAANHDGVWNDEGKSLKIIIHHPIWATWWAYGFYFLFGVGLIYSLRKYEVNRLGLKNQVKLDEVMLNEKEETNKMKSRFFANISHEFRTPLTLISGPIDKILSKNSDEDTIKQAGMIKRNTNRLLDLINQLLDLSKLEAGKLQLKASPGNIVSFLKGITMSFESLAEKKDISLKVTSDKEEIEVYFDKDMMTKILSNLFSNAFKFTPEGGEITVTVNKCHSELNSESSAQTSLKKQMLKQVQHDNSIEIKVKDTGIGISEVELPKLFDRFYQVDSSQTREYEGSGLGLALTKELVELHRGTIKAKSNLGKGSEFIVELPLGRDHLNDDEIVEAAETEVVKGVVDDSLFTKKTDLIEKDTSTISSDDKNIILVVEDNSDVREYIKDSLGNSYQVEEATNGEVGVRKAEQIIPDLIISDIMMPKMDGNELARRIKNDEKTSHIPIILLTAKSEQESRLEGLETGADDYLTKPFDTKELLIRIKNLITIRKKLQEKFSDGKIIVKKDEKRISSLDEKFLNKALEVVEIHLSEEEFSIEQFGEEVGMSRVQLHRKLKALTGKSASLYLRSVRLAKAKEMIEEKKGNISEIAYSVGFSSPNYFTACFKEEFGFLPSEIRH